MPKRATPKRELNIQLNEEAIRDAMALWINRYHGIKIDTRKIVISAEHDNQLYVTAGISATVAIAPKEKDNANTSPANPKTDNPAVDIETYSGA